MGQEKKNCVGTKIASEIIRMLHIFFFLMNAVFLLEENLLTETPEGFDAAIRG